MPNIVMNPGFEEGLSYWSYDRATLSKEKPFEGTAAARMGPGAAELFQDIAISAHHTYSKTGFLLSFAVQAPLSYDPGDLSVRVTWLRENDKPSMVGLSRLIPSATIGLQLSWLTLTDAIIPPEHHADQLRVQFRKAAGTGPQDVLDIDQVLIIFV